MVFDGCQVSFGQLASNGILSKSDGVNWRNYSALKKTSNHRLVGDFNTFLIFISIQRSLRLKSGIELFFSEPQMEAQTALLFV